MTGLDHQSAGNGNALALTSESSLGSVFDPVRQSHLFDKGHDAGCPGFGIGNMFAKAAEARCSRKR